MNEFAKSGPFNTNHMRPVIFYMDISHDNDISDISKIYQIDQRYIKRMWIIEVFNESYQAYKEKLPSLDSFMLIATASAQMVFLKSQHAKVAVNYLTRFHMQSKQAKLL